MLKKTLFFSVIITLVALRVFFANDKSYSNGIKYEVKGYQQYWQDRIGDYDSNEELVADQNKARKEVASVPVKRALGIDWSEVGPDNIGGRTRALLIDSENPKLIFAGGVAGGLWYSEDGGQSWNQTTPGDQEEMLTITCITQDSDGYIYYGTGEGLFYGTPGDGGSGFVGKGVFRSKTPHGIDFKHMDGSWLSNIQKDFVSVNAMAADGNGNVYAACLKRLYRSQDSGETWQMVSGIGPFFINKTGWDVAVTNSGYVVVALGDEVYSSPNGDPGSFSILSSGIANSFSGRITLAIAPSNDNVIYISSATQYGVLDAIYQTKDKGLNWTKIVSGGSSFFEPFTGGGPQGNYDQCIAVYPNNPNKILLGGIEVYRWEEGGNWEKLSQWNSGWGDHNYVHSDIHTLRFDSENSNLFYIGTDGGVFRTLNDGDIFERLNRGYGVTQIYGLSSGSDGVVLAGTQDNSNVYIDGKGNTPLSADLHNSGDGGWTAVSQINPDAFFVESQFGKIGRNNTRGSKYTDFFQHDDSNLENANIDYDGSWNTFITPFLMWESEKDELVEDSILFTANQSEVIGDEVNVSSGIVNVSFKHTLTQNLNPGDEIKVKNPVQALFVYPSYQYIWITREPLDFSKSPEWIKLTNEGVSVASRIGVSALDISKDGDVLYYGTEKGKVYRVKNLSKVTSDANSGNAIVDQIADLKTKDGGSAFVSSISVDPNDKEHVMVTVGYYDQDTNVYVSTTAASTNGLSSFYSIQGDLPNFPVYSSLIEHYSGSYIVGTEYGVYSSTDNGNTWTRESSGLPFSPTTMISQQVYPKAKNFGQIYVGTHGRGLFTSEHYVGTEELKSSDKNVKLLKVFPNPFEKDLNIELPIKVNGDFNVRVFDLNGKLVLNQVQRFVSGKTQILNLEGLSKGSYHLSVIANEVNYSNVILK